MSWYLTNVPKQIALEYATLLAQEQFESVSLASSLGRFRQVPQLAEIAKVNCEREYGLDGRLYIRCRRDPLSYLKLRDAAELGASVTSGPTPDDELVEWANFKLEVLPFENPPVPSQFSLVRKGARGDVEGGHVIKEISGLLRGELLDDAWRAIEDKKDKVVCLFLPPQTYLQFLAEVDSASVTDLLDNLLEADEEGFIPTSDFPMLKRGIQGAYNGAAVILDSHFNTPVVAGRKNTVVVNAG